MRFEDKTIGDILEETILLPDLNDYPDDIWVDQADVNRMNDVHNQKIRRMTG